MLSYYFSDERDVIKTECACKIQAYCSVYGALDEPRKMSLVVILVQYMAAKYIEPGSSQSVCDFSVDALVTRYPIQMANSVSDVLRLYKYLLHAYGSDEFRKLWDKVWNKDEIGDILRSEGFM